MTLVYIPAPRARARAPWTIPTAKNSKTTAIPTTTTTTATTTATTTTTTIPRLSLLLFVTPTETIPTKIRPLEISWKLPMVLRIPALEY